MAQPSSTNHKTAARQNWKMAMSTLP
jgi:hypothetical protein